MAIMRRLLVDAQVRFRKMVEDNRKLATRIDGSIQSANQEMFMLRQELDDTNKRLIRISGVNLINGKTSLEHKSKALESDEDVMKLKEENLKLESELTRLQKDVSELRVAKTALSEQPNLTNLKMELLQYQNELVRAKEALQDMKADRKRLKAEKVDLLSQMKTLYSTLEEKEVELRDFIQRYEQQGQQTDQTIRQLEETEREKWGILARAWDAAENAVHLKTDLDSRDSEIVQLRHELAEAQDHIRGLKVVEPQKNKPSSFSDLGISSGTDMRTPSDEHLPVFGETPPQSAVGLKSGENTMGLSLSFVSKESETSFGAGPSVGLRALSAEDVSQDGSTNKKQKKKIKTSFGSLSRMFGRAKTRRSIAMGEHVSFEEPSFTTSSPERTLCADNINEKIETARRLGDIPLNEWQSHQVLAWLEITMNMPAYGRHCAIHIRNGKMLHDIGDTDLEAALNITNYFHRKKLRLSIDELKNPSRVQFPKAADMDHNWVSQVWIHDLGLPQYSAMFDSNYIDGRILNSLTKKELERKLNISRKFHQASIMLGVELLRRIQFDKHLLVQRRSQCHTLNTDPIVWTNERLVNWVKSIDLEEYAHGLRETGVHGAVLVLEASFTAEAMAAALAIPSSTSHIRKLLTTEYDILLKPARAVAGSVGKSFERSFRAPGREEDSSKKRISFRGSLGRAFGRKLRPDLASPLEVVGSSLTPDKRSHSHENLGTSV